MIAAVLFSAVELGLAAFCFDERPSFLVAVILVSMNLILFKKGKE